VLISKCKLIMETIPQSWNHLPFCVCKVGGFCSVKNPLYRVLKLAQQ